MVDVVGPLGVHAAPLRRGRDRGRLVLVRLGDQRCRTPQARRRDGVRQLGEDVPGRVVHEGVHGVQAQAVDVVVTQPLQCVVDDERPDAVGVGVVQVHGVAPRGVVAGREVGGEHRRVVARRPEVVVDHVEADAQAQVVGGVDEAVQGIRAAVRLVDGEQAHAVVAPAAASREGRERHEFDDVDAQLDQVREPFDGRIQGSGWGERSHVQFVEHPPQRVDARPVGVRPVEVEAYHPGRSVDSVWLEPAARIGSGLAAVDAEQVVGAHRQFCGEVLGVHPRHLYYALCRAGFGHGLAGASNHVRLGPRGQRRPQPDLNHAGLTHRNPW